MNRPLTAKQAAFVQEFLVDLNATQAAIRAGFSAKSAERLATRLLKHPGVSAAIAEAQKARAERTQITADDVLRELWAIGTANPNDLVQFRRNCCRHCWGEAFRYQRTHVEMDRRVAAYTARQEAGEDDMKPFDADGGVGFDARRAPHPDCPECFGEGIGEAHVADTRNLSEEARRLYAGVKVTKDGIEVKMHDKVGALVQVGRHLGMFTDKTELTGKGGGPVEIVAKTMTPKEAAEAYASTLNGDG